MRQLIALLCLASSLMASTIVSGEGLDLKKHEGKVVYVDFWASWCIPCRASFPFMHDLVAKFGEELVVIAVNVDTDKRDALDFLTDFDINFEILYDPQGELASAFDLKGMPTSYLYDRRGTLLGTHIGFRQKDIKGLERAIANAIAGS